MTLRVHDEDIVDIVSVGECHDYITVAIATAYGQSISPWAFFVVVQVQLTVVIEGRYRVLVTIHSFVLFESRCAKCYVGNSTTPRSGLCCDGSNGSCPNSCDILIAFRQNNLGGTNQFYLEGTLGQDFKANEVQRYNETGKIGFQSFAPVNPLQYGIETLDQVRREDLLALSPGHSQLFNAVATSFSRATLKSWEWPQAGDLQLQGSCNNMQTFTIIRLENSCMYQFMMKMFMMKMLMIQMT